MSAERRCPVHRFALVASIAAGRGNHVREVLTCPAGHATERWIVVDLAAGVVLAGATFERITLLAPFDPIGDFRPAVRTHRCTNPSDPR